MTIRSDLEAVESEASALAEIVRGTTDPAVLFSLRPRALALLASVDAVRGALDVLDVDAVVEDGAGLISAALWERESRIMLVDVARGARRLVAALAALEPGGYRQRVYAVRSGDTLQSIAAHEMGSWERWTQLLAANRSIDPSDPLMVGTTLIVPAPE